MMYEGATVRERVARGEAWLDEHVPDWLDRVELTVLSLSNCQKCVLGQVFEDEAAAEESGLFDPEDWDSNSGFHYATRGRSEEWAISHGFDAVPWEVAVESDFADEGDFDALQAEWEARIQERRAARVMQDA